MALTLRSLEPRHANAWDAFVASHPSGTFFHRAAWAEVIASAFGHTSLYTLAERDGMIVGVLPLAHMKTRLFGNTLVSTPFCVYGAPLAADAETAAALATHAEALRARSGASVVELRHREPVDDALLAGVGSAGGWRTRSDLYVTFRKPIVASDDANLKAIPRKQRAMVRKGIHKQLQVQIDSRIDRVYDIYSESLRNLGTPVFSRRYLRLLKETFGEQCEVLTITSAGQAVASVLSFYFRDEVLPYYGGGTAAARSVAANDFMYWQVMERARLRGAKLFDFGRSKRGTGSFDFKTHWGFEPQPLCYEYFLVKAREMPNLSPTNSSYARLIDLWQRLPLPLTRLIGPPIARYLG
jgi:FemAB-related protein (PEP-CTERM system-associated)